MKRFTIYTLTIIMALFILCLTGCGNGSNEIQGVTVTDSGEVAVTFTVPEGMTVEEVIGSEIGIENTFFVSNPTDPTDKGSFTYWYEVSNGGILSKRDNVYCYGPKAEVSNKTGTDSPPAWVMLYTTPSDNEILIPDQAPLVAEKYGINLSFK